jgi:apolipoprotein N-acyltransferase
LFLLLSLFILSAALLTVIQAPIDWSFLAWVALVPFVLACTPAVRTKRLFLWAYLGGCIYWLVSLYWIVPITIPGWIFLCLYMGLLWPLLAVVLRWCRTKSVPLFLAVPVLVVGVERWQGWPMGGFYWRLLGHSQYDHIRLIQIADIFGAGGVSFLVALVNGLLTDLVLVIRSRRGREPAWARAHPAILIGAAVIVIGALAGALAYGQWRIDQSEQAVTAGPLVASLQSNVPQSVKRSFSNSDVLFDGLLAKSRAAAAAGADLIVWPETMVQGILQPQLWPILRDPNQDQMFYETLAAHAKDTAYVLVGAIGADILSKPDGERYLGNYNSAFLFRPDGKRDPGRYDKIHLVLFGEYMPFRHSFPWLIEQIQRLMPEAYRSDYSLEHGKNYTIFDMQVPIKRVTDQVVEPNAAAPSTKYHFAVIICYEDTVPYVARNFALDEQGNKRIDWLVNISNDGWFVRFLDKKPHIRPSAELPQHAAICAFRAVENRLPVIRSVNTGISCLIDSLGRIHDGYIAGSDGFPRRAMHRTGLEGWFLDRLPIDKRVTFYSRHGQWLDNTCAFIFAALLVARCGAGLKGARIAKRSRPTKQ